MKPITINKEAQCAISPNHDKNSYFTKDNTIGSLSHFSHTKSLLHLAMSANSQQCSLVSVNSRYSPKRYNWPSFFSKRISVDDEPPADDTSFNDHFPGPSRVSRYQNVSTLDFIG